MVTISVVEAANTATAGYGLRQTCNIFSTVPANSETPATKAGYPSLRWNAA